MANKTKQRLSLAKVWPLALTYLDSLPPHHLVICIDGCVPFLFGKGGSGVLANCSLWGTEAWFSFLAGLLYVLVFSAKACSILQTLRWSRQPQQIRHFSSFSPLALCLSFYLKISGKNCLPSPSLLFVTMGPGYSFFTDKDATDKLTRQGALLLPSAILCSLSLLSYLIFFSRTGGVPSHLNSFDTQVPSVSTNGLALSRLRCNGHSLLLN